MDIPSLKCQVRPQEHVQLKECGDYSLADPITNGFTSIRAQLCVPHPLEQSEKKFRLNSEKMRLAFLQSSQGIHAPLKIMFEKKAVQKVQRLPFLPSSNLALETLEGRDESIDFDDDIFNDPVEVIEAMAPPHQVMEKFLFE